MGDELIYNSFKKATRLKRRLVLRPQQRTRNFIGSQNFRKGDQNAAFFWNPNAPNHFKKLPRVSVSDFWWNFCFVDILCCGPLQFYNFSLLISTLCEAVIKALATQSCVVPRSTTLRITHFSRLIIRPTIFETCFSSSLLGAKQATPR